MALASIARDDDLIDWAETQRAIGGLPLGDRLVITSLNEDDTLFSVQFDDFATELRAVLTRHHGHPWVDTGPKSSGGGCVDDVSLSPSLSRLSLSLTPLSLSLQLLSAVRPNAF